MVNLPGLFPRHAVLEAFDALGLSDPDVSHLEISGTEVEVGVFVRDDNGDLVCDHGEAAQVFVTIPIYDPED